MPALTVYLSRLIGVVMLIVAAAMLADKTMVAGAVNQLGEERSAMLLLGFVRVTFGVGIVLVHNVWSRGFWPLLVTLTGWAMLVRGVMGLFVPPDVMAGLIAAAHFDDFYYLYAAAPLLLGIYLTLRGFSAVAPPIEIAAAPPATKPPPEPKRTPRR